MSNIDLIGIWLIVIISIILGVAVNLKKQDPFLPVLANGKIEYFIDADTKRITLQLPKDCEYPQEILLKIGGGKDAQ